ncbi:type IV conjugative transfer system lipoprotein TraV [Salmonella enterica]|uniref:type IV conjugative transfer system lipoprotein TraV n=1 Tax=Citrobacter TaxID=544 RepID=UPI002097D908|nr:type IV conjugative transfer system lipoprotein TraV [Citrobacter freundii]EIA4658337.1 type IV conjugative transfer system lipoprotein TraV [Salmonella enterica]ELU8076043.1 type IV conjugative transfer system lipoprotein TraV [Salmonella enterica]MEB6855216.1 type IV conjugative transfer system lipoprotein TraV [Escherichia coli]
MKILPFMLAGSVLLLSGCTGMKSEFDCADTALNGCLTMDEANNRARVKTEGEKQQIRLPELAEIKPVTAVPPVVAAASVSSRSVSTAAQAPVATASVRAEPVNGTSPRNPFRGDRSLAHPVVTPSATAAPVSATGMTVASTSAPSAWADTGMQPPVRLPSGTARLWIAAWVDENLVHHQPSVVSFEVAPARWATQGGN